MNINLIDFGGHNSTYSNWQQRYFLSSPYISIILGNKYCQLQYNVSTSLCHSGIAILFIFSAKQLIRFMLGSQKWRMFKSNWNWQISLENVWHFFCSYFRDILQPLHLFQHWAFKRTWSISGLIVVLTDIDLQ